MPPLNIDDFIPVRTPLTLTITWDHSTGNPLIYESRHRLHQNIVYSGPKCTLTVIQTEVPFTCTISAGNITEVNSNWRVSESPLVYGRNLSVSTNRTFAARNSIGMHGTYTSLKARYQGALINTQMSAYALTDTSSNYPRVFDCLISDELPEFPNSSGIVTIDYVPVRDTTYLPYVGDCRGEFTSSIVSVEGPMTVLPYIDQICSFIMILEYYLNLPVTPFPRIDYQSGGNITGVMKRIRTSILRLITRIDLIYDSTYNLVIPDQLEEGTPLMVKLIEDYMGVIESLVKKAHAIGAFPST